MMRLSESDKNKIRRDDWDDQPIAEIKRQVIDVKFWGFWGIIRGLAIAGCGIALIYIGITNYIEGEVIDSDIYRKYGPNMVLIGALGIGSLFFVIGLWWARKNYKSIKTARQVEAPLETLS